MWELQQQHVVLKPLYCTTYSTTYSTSFKGAQLGCRFLTEWCPCGMPSSVPVMNAHCCLGSHYHSEFCSRIAVIELKNVLLGNEAYEGTYFCWPRVWCCWSDRFNTAVQKITLERLALGMTLKVTQGYLSCHYLVGHISLPIISL